MPVSSGRWQARYAGPDGVDRPGPNTFKTQRDAEVWLTLKEAEIKRGDWLDPDAGKVPFDAYAESWINDHVLKPRTAELYRGLLKNHLVPTFGSGGWPTSESLTCDGGGRNGSNPARAGLARLGRSQWRRPIGCCTRF